RILVAPHLLALELPQAVLGRDRAAERVERVVDDAAHLFAARHQGRGADVVVQVAVANVAEAIDLHAGERALERGRRPAGKVGNLRDRDRDIVLYIGELRLGNRLPDAPQRARLLAALRERRIAQSAAPGAFGERGFDALAQRSGRAAVAELDQDVPR